MHVVSDSPVVVADPNSAWQKVLTFDRFTPGLMAAAAFFQAVERRSFAVPALYGTLPDTVIPGFIPGARTSDRRYTDHSEDQHSRTGRLYRPQLADQR